MLRGQQLQELHRSQEPILNMNGGRIVKLMEFASGVNVGNWCKRAAADVRSDVRFWDAVRVCSTTDIRRIADLQSVGAGPLRLAINDMNRESLPGRSGELDA
ncbi:hypothetical protein X727_33045 [Mesorhizobium sp. L103C119B0]|nr:hypothetical protein X727_33045 [Mesorhizobium sp. L103C119B0]